MNGGARFDNNLQCFGTYICMHISGGHIPGNDPRLSQMVVMFDGFPPPQHSCVLIAMLPQSVCLLVVRLG
jgi:hypothetical protein